MTTLSVSNMHQVSPREIESRDSVIIKTFLILKIFHRIMMAGRFNVQNLQGEPAGWKPKTAAVPI